MKALDDRQNKQQKVANAVRVISADAVQKAKSGHPGMPMGMADIGVELWLNHLKHNPSNPRWANRDRFILSNGHGSMLIYSLLHLTGYSLTIDDLKKFRQLHSKTPGHPEYGYTDGVETTTGPLGQGLANAVGMALSEKVLAHQFNRDGFDVVNHHTYVFVGDGCLMEGISHEVCSLAGTIGLGKLIVIYDDNGISIDGEVDSWFSEDVAMRFKAYGWQVIAGVDGHNIDNISSALNQAKSDLEHPSLVICKTIIGKGSPNKAGKEESHGAPLGDAEIELVRESLGWTYPPFVVPEDIYATSSCRDKGGSLENAWNNLFADYQIQHPELALEFNRRMNHNLPANWDQIIDIGIQEAIQAKKNIATRKASEIAIEFYAKYLPELYGGSADLTGSNLTKWQQAIVADATNNFTGNYLSYGVREFGMSAMLNGMFLHGGLKPFGGTFLMFSEYARNALRMASLMKIAPIFVYTHDSIGLGEDGPTHQPIEQISTLRLIPNMQVWRPCDTTETITAWGMALKQNKTPSSLIFSRQNLPFIERDLDQCNDIKRGGYVLRQSSNAPQILIIATGSEVALALDVYEELVHMKYNVQLVSMPCTQLFDAQDCEYKQAVLAPNAKYKFVIEAGASAIWYKYVGNINSMIFGIDQFGESAPASDLFDYFGLTKEKILPKIKNMIQDL
jgi:transketolase